MSAIDTQSEPLDPSTTAYWPIKEKDEIIAELADQYDGDGYVFETSNQHAPVHYTAEQFDRMAEHGAQLFAISGLAPDAGMLNLAAPFNDEERHISGISLYESLEQYRAHDDDYTVTALNGSLADYQDVIADGRANVVDAVASVPLLLVAKGKEMQEQYGEPPRELFGNLEYCFTSGDLVTDNVRSTIRDLYGVSEIREIYAMTEVNWIATAEDNADRMVPMYDSVIPEIVSFDSGAVQDDELTATEHDIQHFFDVDEVTDGALLLSEPDRLMRYDTKDNVRVYPGDPPTFSFLGRRDSTINLAGAQAHASQIDDALQDTLDDAYADITDWIGVGSKPDLFPVLDVYVVGPDTAPANESFETAVRQQSSAIDTAYTQETIDDIALHTVETAADLEMILDEQYNLDEDVFPRFPKPVRIAHDESFR
jgi:hypothetical protein